MSVFVVQVIFADIEALELNVGNQLCFQSSEPCLIKGSVLGSSDLMVLN